MCEYSAFSCDYVNVATIDNSNSVACIHYWQQKLQCVKVLKLYQMRAIKPNCRNGYVSGVKKFLIKISVGSLLKLLELHT